MSALPIIRELRESIGRNRKEFSVHTGIPVRTIEASWNVRKAETGRERGNRILPGM